MGDELELINKAIQRAKDKFDEYNGERYQKIKESYIRNDDITIAQYMDVRLYLGLNVD